MPRDRLRMRACAEHLLVKPRKINRLPRTDLQAALTIDRTSFFIGNVGEGIIIKTDDVNRARWFTGATTDT